MAIITYSLSWKSKHKMIFHLDRFLLRGTINTRSERSPLREALKPAVSHAQSGAHGHNRETHGVFRDCFHFGVYFSLTK